MIRAPTIAVLVEIHEERDRQVAVEGWSAAHDDQHVFGELAAAAASYALHAGAGAARGDAASAVPLCWPWPDHWWKSKDERRDLVRAAALIVAEIERIDRATARSNPSDGGAIGAVKVRDRLPDAAGVEPPPSGPPDACRPSITDPDRGLS